MAIEYNPELIQKLADKLYSQANTSIVLGTFIGLIAGGGFGFLPQKGLEQRPSSVF